MPRLTLPILLALSFVLAPFTAASHARSRITTSAEIVSSELQTELLQEAADAFFLAALAADFELWTVIIAPEKPTMEAESCAPVVGFFVWGLMPRPPPLDAKTRARAFDLEDDDYAELQAFLTQNPPLGYGLFRADLTTGIPELMFWDPNGLERGMLPSSHIQSNNLMADMGVISAEDASRINGIIEKHKEDPIYTILFYAGAGEILVVSALTFGSGIVIAGMSVGATIDSTYQIDQSLKAFDQGQIRFYDPLQAADSMVIGGALAGPTMLLPRPLLYALQAGVGGHGVYQITQENYVSGTTEIIMSLAPFASREYRGQLFKDLQFEIPPLEIPASLVEPVQGPWAFNPSSGLNTTADVSALTAEEIAFLESWKIGASKSTAKYVFDSRTGQYRDVVTGLFVSPRNLPWPKYPGFSGSPKPTTLQPGQVIDRFGGLSGEFAGIPGTSASARGLPPGSELRPYTQLEVLKPLPTMSGPAAGVSDFGATGGATQYWFKGGIQQWIDSGHLGVVK